MAVAWNAISRDSVFVNYALAPDSAAKRIAGHRFRIAYYKDGLLHLDSTKVVDDAGIRFVDRLAFYNVLTGALDSLGLNAARVRLSLNGDGLGELVTLPTSPALPLGTRYTALHVPMRDSLGTATLDNTLGHRYGYDDPGRLAHEISVPNDKGRDFTYDGLGRLTSVVFKAKGSFAPCGGRPG